MASIAIRPGDRSVWGMMESSCSDHGSSCAECSAMAMNGDAEAILMAMCTL